MLIHRVGTGQQLAEVLKTNRQRNRQTNRRPHRIASTHPVPEREHVFRIDPKGTHCLGVGRDRDKVARQFGRRCMLQKPAARRLRVHHGFLRGKCLGGDDEQGRFRIDLLQHRMQIVTIDIRHEVHPQARMRELAQCGTGHLRTKM